jgi:hypothetical protein
LTLVFLHHHKQQERGLRWIIQLHSFSCFSVLVIKVTI